MGEIYPNQLVKRYRSQERLFRFLLKFFPILLNGKNINGVFFFDFYPEIKKKRY